MYIVTPDKQLAPLRRQEVQFGLAVLIIAGFVLFAFCMLSGVNLHRPALFVDMLDGTAHRPYVSRVLIPIAIRLIAGMVPETLRSLITSQVTHFPLMQISEWLKAPSTSATELLIFLSISYFCLVGFAIGLRELARSLQFSASRSIALLGLTGLVLFFRQGYIYDFGVLLTWVWLFTFVQKQKWWAYLVLSTVLALNKETALLAPLFWLVYGWHLRKILPYWRILIVQSVIVASVWLTLRWAFRFNPGEIVEVHWQSHLLDYTDNPWSLLAIFSLAAITIALAWPQAPRLVRSALILLVPLSVLYVQFGIPYELRVFYELYPIGILCAVLAFHALEQRYMLTWHYPISSGWERILLSIILLTAFALRITLLDKLPSQWNPDEFINYLIAQKNRFEVLPNYVGGADGGEPLFNYLLAIIQDILPGDLFPIRFLSVLGGVMAVVLIYRLASDMQGQTQGKLDSPSYQVSPRTWIPVLAAISLATSLWPVTVGRLGLRTGLALPLFTLTLVIFWRAWSRKSHVYSILGGIVLSLTFYTTMQAFWLVVVIVAFTVNSWLVFSSKENEQGDGYLWLRTKLAIFMIATATFCSFPQILFYWENPTLIENVVGNETVFLITDPSSSQTDHDRIKNNYLAIFEDIGFPAYTQNIRTLRAPLIGAPIHNIVSLTFFLIGAVLALRRFAAPNYRLVVIWFIVMLAPALISGPVDHKIIYLIGLTLPATLLFSIGGDALLRRIPHRLQRSEVAYALPVIVLMLNSFMTINSYVSWWSEHSPRDRTTRIPTESIVGHDEIRYPLRAQFDNGINLLGYSIIPDRVDCSNNNGQVVQLATYWQRSPSYAGPLYAPRLFTHLMLADRQIQDHQVLLESYPVSVWGEKEIVRDYRGFVVPENVAPGRAHFEIGLFWRDFQGIYQRHSILDDSGNPVADQVVLAPIMVCAEIPEINLTDFTQLEAVFDHQIILTGMKQTFNRTETPTLDVEIGWQAMDRMPTDYSAFVHLVDEQGSIIAQHDQKLGDPTAYTSLWVPGEARQMRFSLQIPLDADVASLRLRIGIYELVSGRQLPVVIAGVQQPDSYLLMPISLQ